MTRQSLSPLDLMDLDALLLSASNLIRQMPDYHGADGTLADSSHALIVEARNKIRRLIRQSKGEVL